MSERIPSCGTPCTLSPDKEERIRTLRGETGFSFARLDFLHTPDGLSFLELNPNGQFASLVLRNECGLMTAIADEIMRIHSPTKGASLKAEPKPFQCLLPLILQAGILRVRSKRFQRSLPPLLYLLVPSLALGLDLITKK